MKMMYVILGVLIGFCGSLLIKPNFSDQFNLCVEELLTCQDALNDPHHCVSVVAETLEGKDGSK